MKKYVLYHNGLGYYCGNYVFSINLDKARIYNTVDRAIKAHLGMMQQYDSGNLLVDYEDLHPNHFQIIEFEMTCSAKFNLKDTIWTN